MVESRVVESRGGFVVFRRGCAGQEGAGGSFVEEGGCHRVEVLVDGFPQSEDGLLSGMSERESESDFEKIANNGGAEEECGDKL